ncbi:DUF1450 domain-containing protein [Pallidibacillus pasinlerensis]|uniref:DUF1450 domain-containing protein n=1 Tax=Pallidibacillus pasinlerensis TaxID=2703818 RepID=A0ABX0A0Q7_9BACI|nr:DUF1450 domain-containing protein [Pallidibacillus pasinlerensis]NCU16916.1 DUF1450 domain-containing protein [Pallidibacillus pasinlerensis]
MKLFSFRKKTPRLEVCTNNLDLFFDDEMIEKLEDLIDEKGIKAKEMDCLDYCDECTCQPHAILNKKYVQANEPNELINLIREKIS